MVTVNPSAPIGPWDVKPTPTGQMVVDFLRGKMVAIARHRAERRARQGRRARAHPGGRTGRVGERYILGNENLSLLEIFSGPRAAHRIRAPRFRVPYALAWAAAAAMEGVSPR